ncbi:MAG: DUF885 family protein [Kangiellaceae bacterium]
MKNIHTPHINILLVISKKILRILLLFTISLLWIVNPHASASEISADQVADPQNRAHLKTNQTIDNRKLSITFEELKTQFSQFELAPPQLDFSEFYKQQLNSAMTEKSETISKFQRSLSGFSSENICESIAASEMSIAADLAIQRESLLASSINSDFKFKGSFYKLENGKQWYLHWLKSWLLSDIKINELEKIALMELSQIDRLRDKIKQRKRPPNTHVYLAKEKDKIISALRNREKIVNQNLKSSFGYSTPLQYLHIVESDLPKSFPAPGIYNSATQEFIYHLQTDQLPERYLDWLFLHEGLPGHHFQSQIAIHHPLCKAYGSVFQSSVFAEGWAAYVETIGEELGLYTDSSSELYALDWRALRALRVLLDIGIHFHGWSDDKARQVWMRYIPEQEPIMAREIQRIHNWPVQVITYVYGKHRVEESIKRLQQKGIPLTKIRNSILSLSNYSLNALDHLESVLLAQDKLMKK